MDFTKIPNVVLFIITLICAVASSNYKAYYVKKTMKFESEQYSFNTGASLICAFVLFALNGFNMSLSWYSFLMGAAFGVLTMVNALVNAKAIKIGPLGYTTVIMSLSTAITALSGAIFWDEVLSVFKVIGIILMLVCFVFAVDLEDSKEKKANINWFILCVFCLLTCAAIGLMQKVHQTSEYKNELMPFLVVAFLVSAAISYAGYLVQKKKESQIEIQESKKQKCFYFGLALLICGVGVAGNNALNLYLSGAMDTAIFFPIANGVPLLSALIVSFVLFKEKLKRKQMIGLIIGLIAIGCLFL